MFKLTHKNQTLNMHNNDFWFLFKNDHAWRYEVLYFFSKSKL